MRILFVLILGCLFCTTSMVQAQDKPVVAVFEIQAKRIKPKADLLQVLTEYLATALSETGKYDVIPPATIRTELLKHKQESFKECHNEKCQIEMGRSLAANKLLVTSIMRIGDQCVVTCRLFDLKKEAAERSAKARGKCDEKGYMASIDEVITSLVKPRAEPEVAKANASQVQSDQKAKLEPLRVRNVAQKIAPRRWKWTLFVEGSDAALSRVRCVEYTLYPTFRNPVKKICKRGQGPYAFAYSSNGWGTFPIKVLVTGKDGSEQRLQHQLKF